MKMFTHVCTTEVRLAFVILSLIHNYYLFIHWHIFIILHWIFAGCFPRDEYGHLQLKTVIKQTPLKTLLTAGYFQDRDSQGRLQIIPHILITHLPSLLVTGHKWESWTSVSFSVCTLSLLIQGADTFALCILNLNPYFNAVKSILKNLGILTSSCKVKNSS